MDKIQGIIKLLPEEANEAIVSHPLIGDRFSDSLDIEDAVSDKIDFSAEECPSCIFRGGRREVTDRRLDDETLCYPHPTLALRLYRWLRGLVGRVN